MSGVLSIFQKVCPSCAAHIAVEAANCACGHEFETAGGDNAASADEQALRDEELYENYLAARAGQAAEAARAAAEWLAAEPGNSDRANAAQLAQEVASSLEADLNEQRAKINAMRRALGPRLMSTPPAKPAAAAAPKPARQAAVRPAAPTQPAAKPHVSATQATPKPAPIPAAKPAPSPAPAVSAAAALPSMSSPYKAAAALDAIKRAKAQEMAAAAVPIPTVSATPPDSFRAEQSARASRAIAEQPRPAHSKDCPNCTAAVPLATTRCRCGYTFVNGTNDLPTLTLCTGDFTALRNSLKLNLGK